MAAASASVSSGPTSAPCWPIWCHACDGRRCGCLLQARGWSRASASCVLTLVAARASRCLRKPKQHYTNTVGNNSWHAAACTACTQGQHACQPPDRAATHLIHQDAAPGAPAARRPQRRQPRAGGGGGDHHIGGAGGEHAPHLRASARSCGWVGKGQSAVRGEGRGRGDRRQVLQQRPSAAAAQSCCRPAV